MSSWVEADELGSNVPGGAVSTPRSTGTLGRETRWPRSTNQSDTPSRSVRPRAACRLSPRTIRRKLTAGAFPNAYKTGAERRRARRHLEDPGRRPRGGRPPAHARAPDAHERHRRPTRTAARTRRDSDGPTVLELVRSDRFGRLRAELAEAVAAAEIALLRAEAERWRVLADERAQALERADTRAEGAHDRDGFRHRDRKRPRRARFLLPHPRRPLHRLRPRSRTRRPSKATSSRCRRSCARKRCATPRRCKRCTRPRRQQNRWWQFWRSCDAASPRASSAAPAASRATTSRAAATEPREALTTFRIEERRARRRSAALRAPTTAAMPLLPVNASVPVGNVRWTTTNACRRRLEHDDGTRRGR